MAISTPVLLFAGNDGTHPYNITTTGAVPAGAVVFIMVTSYQTTPGTMSITTTGGLTWTKDLNQTSGSPTLAIFSAPAPAGLATSTALVATLSGAGQLAAGLTCLYCEGVSSTKEASNWRWADPGSTADWWGGTPQNVTVAGDALLIAQTWGDGANSTSVTDAPGVELSDFQTAAESWTHTGAYRIVTGGGAFTIDGNFATGMSSGTMTGMVAYPALAGAAVIPNLIMPPPVGY